MKNTLERKREKSIRRMVMRELPYFWLHCIVSGVIALLIQIIGPVSYTHLFLTSSIFTLYH